MEMSNQWCGHMLWTWGWTDPTWDWQLVAALSLQIVYLLSLYLRLLHALEMWINLLWGYQTLLRNWVVIKVAFGFVLKHAARHGQSRWDLPLSTWERYLWAPRVIGSRNAWSCYIWLRVNLVKGFRITVSRKGGQLGARPNIVRQRERHVLNLVMVRPIWSLYAFRSWHVLLEAATNYWQNKCIRVMSIRIWTYRVTHLRGWKPNEDWIRIRPGLGY